MIDLIDSHCHVHEIAQAITPTHDKWFSDKVERSTVSVLESARQSAVHRIICASTTTADSELAVQFASENGAIWALIGIHPHEASSHITDPIYSQMTHLLKDDPSHKIAGIGEIGLDHYYNHSSKQDQEMVLRFQIELALEYDLPISFHVRDAFDDFWPIFDSYDGVRGVIHSFTDNQENMEKALERGLYIGVNGIVTFDKAGERQRLSTQIPLDRLLLETDAPYLAPRPFRGKVCEPKHIRTIAEYLAELRGESLETLAAATTANAERLFRLD